MLAVLTVNVTGWARFLLKALACELQKAFFFFPFKLNTMRAADVNPKFPAVQILTSHSTCSNPPGGAGEELHTGRKDAQSKAVAGLLCFPPPLFMKAPPFQCVQQHH